MPAGRDVDREVPAPVTRGRPGPEGMARGEMGAGDPGSSPDQWSAGGRGDVTGDSWSPVASHSEVTFGRGRSEWPPPQAQGAGQSPPGGGERGEPDTISGRTNDEAAASDMEWGEPVWSDAVPGDLPPPAVDWRKSIPREFVARQSPTGRPMHEPIRPETPPPVVPMANGHTYPPAPPAPSSTSSPSPSTGPGLKPAWPAKQEDGAPPSAGRHALRDARPDEPSRANGINGISRVTPAPAPEPVAGDVPTETGDGPRASEPGDDNAPGSDDTGVWNALDREIARALATALAGKLAQYVTGPILPLVADELARMVGSSASPAEGGEGGAQTGERRPRHFGEGTPRR